MAGLQLEVGAITGRASLPLQTGTGNARRLGPAPLDVTPAQAKLLNTSLFELTASNRYATVFLGIADAANGTFEYVNGGHNPPLLFRSSLFGRPRVESLNHAGLPLGMFPKSVYERQQVPLCEGDVLVLYTDGVTDARNSAGHEFGEDRLRETIADAFNLPAAEISDRVRERLKDFVGPNPPFDDITLVVVKRKPWASGALGADGVGSRTY